jgi:hypothetical protein
MGGRRRRGVSTRDVAALAGAQLMRGGVGGRGAVGTERAERHRTAERFYICAGAGDLARRRHGVDMCTAVGWDFAAEMRWSCARGVNSRVDATG